MGQGTVPCPIVIDIMTAIHHLMGLKKTLWEGLLAFPLGWMKHIIRIILTTLRIRRIWGGASYILLNKKIDIDYTNTLINRAKKPAPEIK